MSLMADIRRDFVNHGSSIGSQGFWALAVYRYGKWRYTLKIVPLRKLHSFLYKVLFKFVQVFAGIELPCETIIGKDLIIDHFGGIIVSGYAKIGSNCRLRNGVTIGLRRTEEPSAPKIGNNVDIGAGAKVLGNITIGDNVLIGANAVVLCNVPSNSVAVGVPATIRARK